MDRARPPFLNLLLGSVGLLLRGINRNPIAQRGAVHQLRNVRRKHSARNLRSPHRIRAWKKHRRQIAKASRRENRQRSRR